MKRRTLCKILFVLLTLIITGCNYNPVILNTIETKRPVKHFEKPFVTFIEIPPTAPIPLSYGFVGLRLKKELERKFYTSGFKKGDDLEIVYSFMEIDLGNELARNNYSRYGVGEGKLIVNVVYKDRDKKKLGEITINCIIKSGEFDVGINAVAKEIYTYTRSLFRTKRK